MKQPFNLYEVRTVLDGDMYVACATVDDCLRTVRSAHGNEVKFLCVKQLATPDKVLIDKTSPAGDQKVEVYS